MSDRPEDVDEIRAMCEARHPHTPDETIEWLAIHRLLRSAFASPEGPDVARYWAKYEGVVVGTRAALNEVLGRVLSLPEMVGEPNAGGRSLVRRTEVTDAIDAILARLSDEA